MRLSAFVRKCVDPIHDFIVPKMLDGLAAKAHFRRASIAPRLNGLKDGFVLLTSDPSFFARCAPALQRAALGHVGPVFDHLVDAVEQRVWNGKSCKQHHVCKPTFCGRGNRN